MGEAKRKSRHRREILQGEARCIYCIAAPTTVEHMPPKAMFPNSYRLNGMEYASCDDCNHATRAADAAASFFARISPSNAINELELVEARKLVGTMARIAPAFVREVFDDRKAKHIWAKGRDSVYGRKTQLVLDGPITQALLSAFSAKLGMAFYREYVGHALPLGGQVFTQHYLNSGLHRQEAEAILRILPVQGELRQGRLVSGRLFNYRYNTDNKTIVAAFAAFNDNFFVRVFATRDPKLQDALADAHDKPAVSVGGLQTLSRLWEPTSMILT